MPYPVQLDGTEILMELVSVDGEAAPRLAQTRPEGALLESYFDQVRDAMADLARHGWRTVTCRRTTSWPPATGW